MTVKPPTSPPRWVVAKAGHTAVRAMPCAVGEGPGSENSNLEADTGVQFATGAPTSAENMGSTLDTNGVVCKDDGLCNYAPAAGAAGGPDLTGLNGKSANGVWKTLGKR